MSAALLDDLLAGFATATPAKVANAANRQQARGLPVDSGLCEDLRISANADPTDPSLPPDSQEFAAIRKSENTMDCKERRGVSQDSQDSQGWPAPDATAGDLDLAAVAWTDADMARFLDRRERLLRWGWAEPEAESLAERLVIRDRESDERVMCAECQHYRPGRCSNHRRAGLQSADVGRDLAALLQRCPGFQTVR